MNSSQKNEVYRRKSNAMTSGLVYQHMSSHYRRILNAKPTVDTTSPLSFKSRQPRASKPAFHLSNLALSGDLKSLYSSQDSLYHSSSDDRLIEKIISTEKFSPTAICGMEWSKNRPLSQKNSRRTNNSDNDVRHRPTRPNQLRQMNDLLEAHKDNFQAYRSQFWPRILKSEAESKVKEMRVYHPPKRKTIFRKSQWVNNESETEENRLCKCQGICSCSNIGVKNCKEQSQASSRDSAYNGGTSSTPESRSPTPSQQKQRDANREYKEEKIRVVNHISTQTEVITSWESPSRKHFNKRRNSNDSAYTKLIHDITEEIIEKGHFTDKALTRIVSRHVNANINILNKDRMLKEVVKLRKQLGISNSDEYSEDFLTDDDAPGPNFEISQSKVTKEIEQKNDSSEPDSWASWYNHLQKQRDRSPSKSEKENSPYILRHELNTTFTINKCTTQKPETSWSEDDENDDNKDSDSGKESTIKEILSIDIKESSSDSEEISSVNTEGGSDSEN